MIEKIPISIAGFMVALMLLSSSIFTFLPQIMKEKVNPSFIALAYSQARGSISGIVNYDTNGDLVQDKGDSLAPNWHVTIKQGSNLWVVSTGPSGERYFFSIPGPGTYTVSASISSPYVPTQPLNNSYALTITDSNKSSSFTRDFGIFKNPIPLIGAVNGLHDIQGFSVEGLVFDGSGFLYDIDQIDHMVKKFDKNGNLITTFGTDILSHPGGMTIDTAGNFFVSSWVLSNNSYSIDKFDPDGKFLKSFGTSGLGLDKFIQPRGILFDSKDNNFYATGNNNFIQKFDSGFHFLGKIGSGGGLPWTYFVLPFDVKIDSHGSFFVADTGNNRVQKFDSSGKFLLNIGKSGLGKEGSQNGEFNKPRSLALGLDDHLYVTDTYNDRIQEFDNTGKFLMTFGQLGSGTGQFLNPSGIIVDSSNGNIYVADSGNCRIQIFNRAGTFLSQFHTYPCIMEPYFSFIDNSGNLLVSDGANHRIDIFSALTGTFISEFGSVGPGSGQFHGPRGIGIDPNGNIFVADNYNNRVEKFDSKGKFLLAFGTKGSVIGQFNQPRGLVIDSSGNVLVADTQNNRIQKFDSSGSFLRSITTSNMIQPYQIALDKSGYIYAAEECSSHIENLDPTTGKSLMIIGSKGTGPGQFYLPKGVYVDTNGNIYTTDANDRVQKFSPNGHLSLAFGTQGMGPSQFNNPRGIFVDSLGNIWVDDTQNRRIQEFGSNGNFIKQIIHSE